MTTELHFKILPTEYEEFIQYARKRAVKTNRFLRLTLYVLLPMIVLLNVALPFLPDAQSQSSGANTLMSLLFWIAFLGLLIFLTRFFTKRIQKKQTAKDAHLIFGERTLTFSDEQFSYQTEYSQTTYRWDVVQTVEQTQGLFLLFVSSNQALMIPKRAFDNLQQQMHFEQLVQAKLKAKV